MTKIDFSKAPDFDLLFYSTPCFVAGTKVLTNKGYTNIEEIDENSQILGTDLTFHNVTDWGSKPNQDIVKVSASPIPDIECTVDHPFLLMRRNRVWHNDIRRWRFEFDAPRRCRICDAVADKDFIGIPILPTTTSWEYTDEELWLLGRYVADGHINSRDLILSIGAAKIQDITPHLPEDARVFVHSDSCYRVSFKKDSRFRRIVEESGCGRYAVGKTISPKILLLPKDKLAIFLDGYMSGDGSLLPNGKTYEASTVSKDLAMALVLAVQKVYDTGVKLYYQDRGSKWIIEGREVNQRPFYQLRWLKDSPKHQWFSDGKFIWYPIKKVSKIGEKKTVYNITVDDVHTYFADNAAVFNCTDFSNAGKQAGGEEGSGTRSSVLWFTRNAILTKKPKFAIMENVKALVSDKFRPLFRKWEQELASYGYTNYCKVLNAKSYGYPEPVPQNRERIFLVSILNEDHRFRFPEEQELTKRLKDVLQTDVAEKYYLDDEKVAKFRGGKQYTPMTDGLCRTITTFEQDNLLMETQVQPKRRYRIRKLTPRECGRLMGVRDADIDLIESSGVSESSQYKLYGNSIVVNVLVAIFKNLLIEDDEPMDTLF